MAQAKVATFRHGRRNLSVPARRTFYLSIVQATLDYASNSYVHGLSATLFDRLCVTSQKCLRKVFGLDRFTSVDLILNRYDLYSLAQRFLLKLYTFVYRALQSRTSVLIQNMFQPRCQGPHTSVVTRGQAGSSYILPGVYTRYGYNSISFIAADRWNSLPPDCRNARSLPVFVSHTKLFLGFPVRRPRPVGLP